MEIRVDTQQYKDALRRSIQTICFDRSSGDAFYLEDLFYPICIDEGKYAFQRYAQQMVQARKGTAAILAAGGADTPPSQKDILTKNLLALIRKKQAATQEEALPEATPELKESSGKAATLLEQLEARLSGADPREQNIDSLAGGRRIPEVADLLLDEPVESLREQFVLTSRRYPNRNLAVASAGHGKTTLLRRIALYYCDEDRSDPEDIALARMYGLPGINEDTGRIPCLIYLRNISDWKLSLEKAIMDSVVRVMQSALGEDIDERTLEIIRGQASFWVSAHRDDFLLLIDGLDELADSARLAFLKSLQSFLVENPAVSVILTSRVAGLSETGVKEILRSMEFRGRSIMPLTEEQAYRYSEKWITITQPADKAEALKRAVAQVQKEARFSYLREFMRTPLDLLVVLKRIVHDSLSLNRYQMFYDTLWEHITSHEKRSVRKRQLFEDTMTLLSFLAFQMQRADSLYITVSEIEALREEICHLSFQTSFLGSKETGDIVKVLDAFAANVGLVEKDDSLTDPGYTFPIRAHQEFLTAYACCHLRLDSSLTRTNPSGILSQYIGDSRWLSILNFALSDLDSTNQYEYDLLLQKVFSQAEDPEHLLQIIEADVSIATEDAITLCKRILPARRLSEEQRRLLLSCLKTRSAPAFHHALRTLYNAPDTAEGDYLEAFALTTIVWDYDSGHSPFAEAARLLESKQKKQTLLGATICSYLAQAAVEQGFVKEYSAQAVRDIRITEELAEKLYTGAFRTVDPVFVTALTGLWISRLEGYRSIEPRLDEAMVCLMLKFIADKKDQILAFYRSGSPNSGDPAFQELIELFTVLGMLPLPETLATYQKEDPYTLALLHTLYKKAGGDLEMNQVALAVSLLYFGWDWDTFIESWVVEVCGGKPSELVQKNICGKPERTLFFHLRDVFKDREDRYLEKIAQPIQKETVDKDVFYWFRRGDLAEAANHCIRTMGVHINSTPGNLAFLLRFGKLKQEDLETQEVFDILTLLEPSLEQQAPVAIINTFLYYMEQGDTARALFHIHSLTPDQWKEGIFFWENELWLAKQHPEGALVCVLAAKYGGCKFIDLKRMRQVATAHYPQFTFDLIS